MGKNAERRNSEEFKKYIETYFKLDKNGHITTSGGYARVKIEVTHKKQTVSMSLSHLVWFLHHGEWPEEGMTIDHIDDNPFNNSISNLQELTLQDNHLKRRGKTNNRYGTSKYGHGISVQFDRVTGYYSAFRNKSISEFPPDIAKNGVRNIPGRDRKVYLFCANNLEDLDYKIKFYIEHGMEPAIVKPKDVTTVDPLDALCDL